MCGIVGIIGKSPVAPQLVDALKRLEYRGYDSAGVATLQNGQLSRRRAEGKLVNLEKVLSERPLSGNIGIGHTRWATHGIANETNAHPHQTDKLAVVHNGIIENFHELRAELIAQGCVFSSDTDTETVAHLVTRAIDDGLSPADAVKQSLKRLEGAFAIGIIFKGEEDLIIAARKGAPLAVGFGDGEMYLGSDAIALSPFTDVITYLEDGDWALISANGVQIHDSQDNPVTRDKTHSVGASLTVDKGNHRHFMLKEIYEQPEVISHTLSHYLDFAEGKSKLTDNLPFDFAKLDRVVITACGSSYLSGLIAKYWFERYARLPVDIDIASEFRYREMPLAKNGLSLFISQSGETADTLAALQYCKQQGQHIGAIVNVTESSIARESSAVFPTLAGPEIGVASTKVLTCQMSVLAAMAVAAGRARGVLSGKQEAEMIRELSEAPRLANAVLKLENQIQTIAHDLSKVKHVLYLGRDTNYPLALEGALKLKEISYIHAEGYAAGELKHGPIALIDEEMPVVVIAPHDHIFEKTVSNMQEVAARGGRIILITDETGAKNATIDADHVLILPDMAEILTPIIFTLPAQMLAYHTAVLMGTDVDQPRNLAKSVTVE